MCQSSPDVDQSNQECSPLVSAIIVNHDQAIATNEQLIHHRSIDPARFEQIEWWVVSNGQVPPEPIAGVHFLSTENDGYGAAINNAAAKSQGKTILALNADILPEPGFLEAVFDVARIMIGDRSSSSPVGLVGFKLRHADGSPQGSAGPFPTLSRFLFGLARSRKERKYLPTPTDIATDVDWVTGACLLIDRSCFESLGGFDESYFLYYEDVDLSLRAHQRGYRVLFQPRGCCRHLFPYHARRLTIRMVYVARRALLLYFRKHRPDWEYQVVRRIARLESWARSRQHPDWIKVGRMIDRLSSQSPNARLDKTDWLAITENIHPNGGDHVNE
jgi:N-acetylglucosaminyl-diphospho-decaprenol L-rhamnosyltransferase